MTKDKRLTQIRLPLQIGTSALWSLARTSLFFPGLVIVAVGLWVAWELRDGGEAVGIGIGIAAAGGALIAFAYSHYKHLMAERPSDVVLDEKGLRIEGGSRDGLALAWSEIDAGRCRVATADEKRVTTWRLLANLPLLALSFAGGDDATVGLEQKVPVHRLFVVRKDEDEEVLVAEADVEVEHHSLATLIRTIQSSRWHPGSAKPVVVEAPAPVEPSKKRKKGKGAKPQQSKPSTDRAASIACPKCGATVAPSSHESVTCRFCDGAVPIPSDVRKRVEAAGSLESTRRSGMSRLEQLLASQPSARLASSTMFVAAIPIALAWPIAGWLVAHNVSQGMVTPGRVAAIAALPLLVTFAAIFMARARLTDRFALHAVVIAFGAHDPPRPGEPYRCRECEAGLPEVTTSPIVYCVYCDKPNVLGLDLSGDAKAAKDERRDLEEAFAAREKARGLWRLGGFAALAMIVAAALVVRSTFADIKRVDFMPQYYWATVVSADGLQERDSAMPPIDDPKEGIHVKWTAQIEPSHGRGVNCHVSLHATADNQRPFTYEHDGRCTFSMGQPTSYSDAWTSSKDHHDPKVEIDLRKKTVVIHDEYNDSDSLAEWKLTLHLRAPE